MNEIRTAEIFSATIEAGYTCMIKFYVFDDEGNNDFIQAFGGKQFHTYQDYEIWKNGIENITDRRFEDNKGAVIKIINTEDEDILGIGNLNENYWIVKEKVNGKIVFNFKTTKKEIDDFFEKNSIEHKIRESEKGGDSGER